MKRVLRVLLFLTVFCIFVVMAVVLLPDPYGSAYQRALVRQYEYYKSVEENKIVFIGSSSLCFGLDLNTMEELTGETCTILGNHYGYGLSFLMEMSKSNLKSGDIVVLEIVGNSIETGTGDLLLSGIGHEFEMYRFFIPQTRWKILSCYPSYLKKAILYDLSGGYDPGEGPYSIRSFDEKGNLIYYRDECLLPDPFTEEAEDYVLVSLDGTPYEAEFVKYVNSYSSYCHNIGVAVYITVPPYFHEAVVTTDEDMKAFENMLKTSFDAPVISDQADYIFDRNYLYDGIMHCNTVGAKHRTEMIYRDLVKAGAFD